jgi:hypothetical protein
MFIPAPLSSIMPFLLILIGLYLVKLVLTGGNSALWNPQVRAKPLMTAAELKTLGYLRSALPDAHILAQVSMGALIAPARGLNRSQAQSWRNRYHQKIVDFVAINPRTGAVLALIELDDRYHSARRDSQRDRITQAAGYRTIRLAADRYPTASSVREAVHAALSPASKEAQ